MNFIIKFYYRFLSLFYYFIGDIAWRIPTEWAYFIYQNSMKKSIEYGDLSGAGLWKKTSK